MAFLSSSVRSLPFNLIVIQMHKRTTYGTQGARSTRAFFPFSFYFRVESRVVVPDAKSIGVCLLHDENTVKTQSYAVACIKKRDRENEPTK